jgi:hypothetical protein
MNPITHLRHNLVAYLALFVALGTGTAYAANQITSKDIARNAVKAKHIKDGQVRGAELAASAVTGANLADGSVAGVDVAANSLTGAQIDESSLQLPAPPAPPSQPAPPAPDLSGYAKVIAKGYIAGAGPLGTVDRCNGVSAGAVPGVKFGDVVVITPTSLKEEVVFTGTASDEAVSYQACYTGSGSITLSGDVFYMVLRPQA